LCLRTWNKSGGKSPRSRLGSASDICTGESHNWLVTYKDWVQIQDSLDWLSHGFAAILDEVKYGRHWDSLQRMSTTLNIYFGIHSQFLPFETDTPLYSLGCCAQLGIQAWSWKYQRYLEAYHLRMNLDRLGRLRILQLQLLLEQRKQPSWCVIPRR
jgi:hypothetical protein